MASIELSCLACGHKDTVQAHESSADEALRGGIFRCSECRARMSFGVLMPAIVVERSEDVGQHWVRLRFQDPKTREDIYSTQLDPQYATLLVKNILAIAVS